MNILEKIEEHFNKYQARLLFFFDGNEDYRSDLITGEAFEGFEVLEVGPFFFQLKQQIEEKSISSKLLLYHPYPKPEGDALIRYPLLDLLYANRELRLDDIGDLKETFELKDHQLPLIRKYIPYLRTVTNQKKLARILTPDQFTEENIIRGLVSIAVGFHAPVSRTICLVKLLTLGMEESELIKAIDSIKKMGLEKEVLNWIKSSFHISSNILSPGLIKEMANSLKYNLIIRDIKKLNSRDTYQKYRLDSDRGYYKLLAFYQEWMDHPRLSSSLNDVLKYVGYEIDEMKILSWYGIDNHYEYFTSSMVQFITMGMAKDIKSEPAKVQALSQRWKDKPISDIESRILEFLYNSSTMLVLLKGHKNYTSNTPDEYIRQYSTEYIKIDTAFRKAILVYRNIELNQEELEQEINLILNHICSTYDTYANTLNISWQNMLQEIDFDYNQINAEKQYEFYLNNLHGFDSKVAIIISDAFRYEVAAELYDVLIEDPKNQVEIKPALASVPSYTNLGMSNLLPFKKMDVDQSDQDLVLSIDDKPTTSQYREAILNHQYSGARALKYDEIIKLDRDQGRELFNTARMVYVYHNWIDAIGDKKQTELEAFNASEKAKEDIQSLLSKLYGWNVYHTFITADHGFIFNYQPLNDASREDLPKAEGWKKEHIRFTIAEKFKKKPEGYVFPLRNTTRLDTDLKVALPRAVNRFRKKGNIGLHFAHGGASLQEVVIPVIHYYKRKEIKGDPVSFKRLDQQSHMSGGSIRIDLIQIEPTSNEILPREITIGLYDMSGSLISNEVALTLKSSSKEPKDRSQSVVLTLNSDGSKSSFCYLRAFDMDDKKRLNPISINDKIIIKSLYEIDEF